jgi:uncharacterized small protein (DUF1192 family)
MRILVRASNLACKRLLRSASHRGLWDHLNALSWSNDTMANDSPLSLPELDDRIAIIRDNIRQLTEQAASSSGAADEERTSNRIAEQQDELDKLIAQRDALGKT